MIAFYQTLSNPARYSRRACARRTLKVLWTSALLSVSRSRNLVLVIALSVAAAAWGASGDRAPARKGAAPHSARASAKTSRHVRRAAIARPAAERHRFHRARRRTAARTHSRSRIRTAGISRRSSSTALRRAQARRRIRLEHAESQRIRYAERRRRLENRVHLSRDTVHLGRVYGSSGAELNPLSGGAALNESPAATRPFSEAVALHIRWREMPAPLRGSLEVLERQDERLEAAGLKSIQTEADLSKSIADKRLVPIPESNGLTVNANLKENHRYCRPWTARFLDDLARAHEEVFDRPLEVTSAVRPMTYQEHLERINHNAAPAEGDIVSPHMMGATIDIAKHGLSRREIAWMRVNLLALEETGKIDVEEEFHQACFHITVYPNYAPEHHLAPAIQAHTAAAPAAAHPADATPAPDADPAPQKTSGMPALPQNDSTGS